MSKDVLYVFEFCDRYTKPARKQDGYKFIKKLKKRGEREKEKKRKIKKS